MNRNSKNELQKGWQQVSLKEVCDKIVDGSHNPPKESPTGKYPMISAKDVFNNEIFFDSPRWLEESSFETENRRTNISAGDVLLTIVATIGRSAVVPKNAPRFTLQRSVAVLKTRQDSKYLSYALQSPSFQKQLKDNAKGTAQKGVYLKTLSQLTIPLPSIKEQQEIVSKIEELCSEIDKSIEPLKITQQQLKVYRQSVLKWAFEGTLTNKSPVADELQKRWIKKSLKDLKQFSLYGPRFSSKDYADDGVAILRTSDVDERGKIDWINAPKVRLTNAEYEKYKLVKGDLLITRTGSIGTISVFNDDKKAIPGAFLIHYRLVPDVSPKFVFYFLKTKEAQDHFKTYSFGVGRPNLNVPNIELLLIPIPSLVEQQRVLQEIENRLSVADKLEEAVIDSLQQAEALRQSILKKAFEGKL